MNRRQFLQGLLATTALVAVGVAIGKVLTDIPQDDGFRDALFRAFDADPEMVFDHQYLMRTKKITLAEARELYPIQPRYQPYVASYIGEPKSQGLR